MSLLESGEKRYRKTINNNKKKKKNRKENGKREGETRREGFGKRTREPSDRDMKNEGRALERDDSEDGERACLYFDVE